MLIVWRRAGESVLVGDGVEIEVLEAKAHRVKLGIVAPASVAIVRKEARITRDENMAAALSADRGMIETLLRRLPASAPAADGALTSSNS
ncbi:MAG TPA: carbon storage regulator [Bryobacteraceae bacterium]|nr:carbon storage regulator [Bryobacteraceae bacterium]